MDRRVKERLVGAAILVAIIVLIAPELLSGPKPENPPAPAAVRAPVRSYTVDLADTSAAAHPVETSSVGTSGAATSGSAAPTPATPAISAAGAAAAVAAAGAVVSGTVARAPAGSSAASTEGEAPSRPADPAQVRRPSTPVRTAQNGWWVQLGSFANQTNARRLVHELQAKGFPVYLQSSGTGKAMRHRVRVGPLADREAAMQTAAKLKSQGHPASVVPPAA